MARLDDERFDELAARIARTAMECGNVPDSIAATSKALGIMVGTAAIRDPNAFEKLLVECLKSVERFARYGREWRP